MWYNCYTNTIRFHFDERKSRRLRANPYYLDQRSDLPEQYRAIGWVQGQMYSVVFEIREDGEGEYYHLVTLWKATKQERELYDEHS